MIEDRLGYRFKNRELLERALTHGSAGIVDEAGIRLDNEKLEFLGDGFLDAIVGSELFSLVKDGDEGTLTKLRAEVVCESSLAEIGRNLNLGSYIHLGANEASRGIQDRDSVLRYGGSHNRCHLPGRGL